MPEEKNANKMINIDEKNFQFDFNDFFNFTKNSKIIFIYIENFIKMNKGHLFIYRF